MKMSQGNSLCSYLKQKCWVFFFYKIEEQEGRTSPVWGGSYQWEVGRSGEKVKEGEYVANTVYTCM
jgi:hypothetical protein